MTIHRKIRVAATVSLGLLLLVEVRRRSYEDASARFVEAVGTADAVLRNRHDLGVVEIASFLLRRDATAAYDRLTPWERRLVVPLPPLPLDDPRLGDFPEFKGLSDSEAMAEYHQIRRRVERGPTVNAARQVTGLSSARRFAFASCLEAVGLRETWPGGHCISCQQFVALGEGL